VVDYDEILYQAKSLAPDKRLDLIVRLWQSLPQESWPRSTAEELAEVERTLARQGVARGESVPWPVVQRVLADSVRSSRPKVYSAPKRFDLSTIFAITTGYAVLFGVIRYFVGEADYAAGIALMVGVFVTLVGIGQALLFDGRRPRTASILVGVVVTSLAMVAMMLWSNSLRMPGILFPVLLFNGVMAGIVYGYLGGVAVGGVFLVADLLRRCFQRKSTELPPLPQATEEGTGGC
jgi:hypothetical protein